MIDRAGARAQMLGRVNVTEAEIEHVVFACSRGLSTRGDAFTMHRTLTFPIEEPSGRLEPISFPIEDPGFLLKLESTISRIIIGQDEAVSAVCRSIFKAHVGLRVRQSPSVVSYVLAPRELAKQSWLKYSRKSIMVPKQPW